MQGNKNSKQKMEIESESEDLVKLAKEATLSQKEKVIEYMERAEKMKIPQAMQQKEIIKILSNK